MKGIFVRPLFVLLSLIVLFNLGSATNICDTPQFRLNSNNVATFVAVLITIQLLVAALAYIFAGATESNELKAWGRNEIMQAIFTLIIVATYFAISESVNTYLADMTSKMEMETPADHLSASKMETETPGETRDHLSVAKSACFNATTYRWSVNDNNDKCGGDKYSSHQSGSDKANFVARAYLGLVYERLGEILKIALEGLYLYEAIDSVAIDTGLTVVGGVFGLDAGGGIPLHAVIVNVIQHITDLTVKLLTMLKFQEAVLYIVGVGGLGERVLLLGILLRCIWFLRKAGGLLIALGIGLIFVLPFLYMLGWYTIDINPFKGIIIEELFKKDKKDEKQEEKQDNPSIATGKGGPEGIQSIALAVANGAIIALKAIATANIFGLADKIKTPSLAIDALYTVVLVQIANDVIDYAKKGIGPDNLFSDIAENKIGYFDLLSRYLIVAIVLPLLNLYLLLAFVRGLSPLLGGDHDIPGLSRLI